MYTHFHFFFFLNRYTQSTDEDVVSIVERHIKPKSINIIYISSVAWDVITPLLDSGVLQVSRTLKTFSSGARRVRD